MRIFQSLLAATAVVLPLAATPAIAAPVKYPAIQSTIKYTKVSPTSASGFGNYARATSSITYDPVTHVYVLRDTGNLALTSSFDTDNADASSTAEFTVVKNGANETLRVYNQGATTQGIALTYTGYGHWRRTGTPQFGTGTAVNDTYFVYGTKTAPSEIATGAATYTTALDGTFTNKNGVYKVTGNGTLSANFTGRTIGFSATPVGAREGDNSALAFGPLTGGMGTIGTASSSFKTTAPATGGGYSLNVNGYFFGPSAVEVGGVFRLSGNGGNGQGAMVGRQP